jgi:hypothetical protein
MGRVLKKADALPYDDELATVAIGKRPEQHAIDDAEDSGCRVDAECKSQDSGQYEAWRFAELVQSEAEVSDKVSEEEKGAHLAMTLLKQGCISALAAGILASSSGGSLASTRARFSVLA